MLLHYADDIIKTKEKFSLSYQVYQFLIRKWYQREAKRILIVERDVFIRNLEEFAFNFTKYLVKKNTDRIGFEEIKLLKINNNINIDDVVLRSRSLLNRDGLGKYKFAHKSILEYFIATLIINKKLEMSKYNLLGHNMVKHFLDEYEYIKYESIFEVIGKFKASGYYRYYNSRFVNLKSLLESEELRYNGCGIVELSWLNGFVNLKKVSLLDNSIHDINPLFKHLEITWLNLAYNKINKIDGIHQLRQIRTLYLNNNNIQDISELVHIKDLIELNIEGNKIKNVKELSAIKSLKWLILSKDLINYDDYNYLVNKLPQCHVIYK